MEKVKLTQEQANIISSTSLDELGEWFYKDERTNTDMYEALKDFTMEEIAKAKIEGYEVEPKFKVGDWVYNKNADVFLQIDDKDMATRYSEFPSIYRHATPEEIAKAKIEGYEVEPKFKVGDWVIRTLDFGRYHEKGRVFQIAKFDDWGNIYADDGGPSHMPGSLRHATPEEVSKERQRRWWSKHNRGLWELRKGDVLKADDGGYPIEVCEVFDSRNVRLTGVIPYVKINELKEGYRVICFAEDRKDLGDD